MSKKPTVPPPRPVPRLYLATPVVTDPAVIAATLATLLEGADIAAVLLRLADGDAASQLGRIKALAPGVQRAGAALLLDGHGELVARSGADGAHLTGADATQAALSSLKPDYIVGAGGLTSRHDAMVAGEAGADYVLFGEPVDGQRPSIEAVTGRIAWWAEIFEPPCVGYAQTVAEAGVLSAAGADFILMDDAIWNDPVGPAAAMAQAMQAIAQGHAGTLPSAEAAPE
jgi:thiamine-phosphate pyrophosphorylase